MQYIINVRRKPPIYYIMCTLSLEQLEHKDNIIFTLLDTDINQIQVNNSTENGKV